MTTAVIFTVPDNVTLNTSSQTIKKGQTYTLVPTLSPNDIYKGTVSPHTTDHSKVTWTSSNTSIATVDGNGVVTALEAGETTITVKTTNNKTATAKITVEEATSPDKIPPVISKLEGQKNEKGQFILYITATDNESGIKVVKVNDEDITKNKTEDGRYYFIPKENGNYTIKAIDNSNNEKISEFKLDKLSEKAIANAIIDTDGKKSVKITPKTNREVKTIKVGEQEITSKDKEGNYYFTPEKNGNYEITLEYEDRTEEKIIYEETRYTQEHDKTISVESVTITTQSTSNKMNIGETIALKAEITPTNATNKKVRWKSSNEDVATVNENGLVTGVSAGRATITVETEDGNKTATYEVIIEEATSQDKMPPIIKAEGGKNTEGKYLVYITATDNESGIKVVKVNDEDITKNKTEDGRYYFIPKENGNYTIKAIDNSNNEKTSEFKLDKLSEKAIAKATTDTEGKKLVKIIPKTNKEVKIIKVGEEEIKLKDKEGNYYFTPEKNENYEITIEYEDGTEEKITYKETRYTQEDDNSSVNNNGNTSKNNNKKTSGSTDTTGKKSGTESASVALKELPKTGTTIGILFVIIISAIISVVFAWLRQKREK